MPPTKPQHTPRTNDTKLPWESGIFKDNDGVRHLAIWPESIPLGAIANPACLISLEAAADKLDEANARLIVIAVNHHQELVEALRYLANDVLDHFPALKEPQETCMGLAASYQNARAVLAQVETQKI